MADKNYQITFELSDGTTKTVNFTSPQGEQGPAGAQGPAGPAGETGPVGAQGPKGDQGI
jgi:hypothetical protein